MRPVLPVDLICAARVVVGVSPNMHASEAQALVVTAEAADWHCRTFGRAHPRFGDGTLASVARRRGMAAERTACDPEFAAALISVLQAISRHRAHKTDRGSE